ncbi:MAG: OadG family protein [Bacteroidales bacterium]|nr:OadG family protein [Bacteroidales bacterium]
MNNLMMLSAVREPIATHDWVVTIGGFLIVIMALVVLFCIFTGFSKLVNHDFKKTKKEKKANVAPNTSTAAGWKVDEDLAVVIGLALALSKDVHDEESGFVTIKRVERRYSPWSSKIYGLNGLIRKNY